MGFIERVMHPDWYQGFGGKQPFFEGWYYKLIDAAGEQKWAVIPGVFLSDDPHAFIQVLDGNSQTAFYHRYPLEAFWAADDRFEVRIEESRFAANEMTLAIERGTADSWDPAIPKPFTLASDSSFTGDYGLVCVGANDGMLSRCRQLGSCDWWQVND